MRKGEKMSDEQREKISAALRGRTKTRAHRKALSRSRLLLYAARRAERGA